MSLHGFVLVYVVPQMTSKEVFRTVPASINTVIRKISLLKLWIQSQQLIFKVGRK